MLNRFIKFSYLIGSIHKSVQKILADEMAKYGLKGAYAQYLLTLYKSNEKMNLVELTEKCDNDKAAVSRAVGDMIEKGLILKENDSYRAGLLLTDEGIKAAEFVCERAKIAVEAAGVTEEERDAFYSSLEKLEQNLKIISKKGI